MRRKIVRRRKIKEDVFVFFVWRGECVCTSMNKRKGLRKMDQ